MQRLLALPRRNVPLQQAAWGIALKLNRLAPTWLHDWQACRLQQRTAGLHDVLVEALPILTASCFRAELPCEKPMHLKDLCICGRAC